MPVAVRDVVAVVARPAGVRVRSVVAEVAGEAVRDAGAPVVVARNRPRPGLDRRIAPRGGLVAVREVSSGAVRVDVVAGREDGAIDLADQLSGGCVPGDGARRDITGSDEHGIGARGRMEGPGRAGRREGSVADGHVPLEGLACAEARPNRAVATARRDTGMLRDLDVVAARERSTEVRDRQRVGVGIADSNIKRGGRRDPGCRVGRRIEGRCRGRAIRSNRRDLIGARRLPTGADGVGCGHL